MAIWRGKDPTPESNDSTNTALGTDWEGKKRNAGSQVKGTSDRPEKNDPSTLTPISDDDVEYR